MTSQEALETLEGMGTAQNRKIYKRHGVGESLFGVSYANLKTLKKKVRKDHLLALHLWASGNHDARIFAMMIADPDLVDEALLEDWAADLDNYVVTDAFSGFASKTPFAHEKMEAWTHADEEWIGRAGWQLLAHLAMKEPSLPDAFFESYLETIERDLQGSKNRVKDAMNQAVIAIGIRNDVLEEKAIAAATRIGNVEVDHGATSCKTPAAVPYIRKTWARKKSR